MEELRAGLSQPRAHTDALKRKCDKQPRHAFGREEAMLPFGELSLTKDRSPFHNMLRSSKGGVTSLRVGRELHPLLDFVISGSRGFIGRHIYERLRAAQFSVLSDHDVTKTSEKAKIFVNCANIAGSPSASLALLSRKLDLARNRADCFVQIQSFVTLHGAGSIDPNLINCGMRPKCLDLYAAGKLAQERLIYSRVRRDLIPNVILLYLPVVVGEGGGWSRALMQAQTFGYTLPEELDPMARVNFVEVGDIADFLVRRRARLGSRLERTILNRQESEVTTWPNFLGEQFRETIGESAGAQIKARAMAVAYHAGILLPVERAVGLVRSAPSAETRTIIPERELRFEGMTRYIVANQRYIPSGSVKVL